MNVSREDAGVSRVPSQKGKRQNAGTEMLPCAFGNGNTRKTQRQRSAGERRNVDVAHRGMSYLSAGALILTICIPTVARATTAEEIIKKYDHNMTYTSRVALLEMIIEKPGSKSIKRLRTWGRGESDTYSEFFAPSRDKGTKYLKLEGNLYMFLPRSEKVVKISGHLLRQGMMDSDFSYEDLLESRALLKLYDSKIVAEEEKAGEQCWAIEMRAKKSGTNYESRKIWISQRTFLPILEQRFAKSGMLLKEFSTAKPKKFGDRYYPTVMMMQDKTKTGTKTTLVMTELQFGVEVKASLFSRRNLMRGR